MLNVMVLNVQAQPSSRNDYDLYILIGQSNMAGRGVITPEINTESDQNVFMLTKDLQWVMGKHPVHFDKPSVSGVGPGLTFGIAMAQATPGREIGLIPCAVGGTPIEHWEEGAFDPATKTHPYDDAVERIKFAMKFGKVKGVIWLQGESNSNAEKAKIYLAQLAGLIQRVRVLVGDPNLPFVAGELGRYKPSYQNINEQLANLPAAVPFTSVASSEGLFDKGDTTHFNGPSAQEMGRRMAAKMIILQKSITSNRKLK